MKAPQLPFKAEYADIESIGIPRALLFFRYEAMWKTFFRALGRTVIVSPPSDRGILEKGEALSVDECCLASKLYLGHAASLADKCDALFIPSIDNLGFFEGFCTKFQALPDLVKSSFAHKKLRIVSCEVDKSDTGIGEEEAYVNLALRFGVSKKAAKGAYSQAVQAQAEADRQKAKKQNERLEQLEKKSDQARALRILIVAHPYVIHDAFIGASITDTLGELGAQTFFADEYNRKRALKKSYEFSQTLPWIINRELIGAVLELYNRIDGLVIASAFPCGPDSMTNDAFVRCIKGKPILALTIDAQSGTAGLQTRLESFVDILNYQRKGGYLHG